MQEISAALRMGGGGKDRPLVLFQDLQPTLNIGRVIGAHLWSQFQIGTKECRAQLGDQLLARIAFIAPFLSAKFTIKTALVLGPMGLMPMSA